MGLAANGPLLREVERPIVALATQRNGVLDFSRFLVVGLLDEEGVVLHALDERLLLLGHSRRSNLVAERQRWQCPCADPAHVPSELGLGNGRRIAAITYIGVLPACGPILFTRGRG